MRARETMLRESKGNDEEGTEKRMNPVLFKAMGQERTRRREKETNAVKREEERITRGEGREERRYARAGMSRLLVSQTRGRYLQAHQWQSTGIPESFVGPSVVVAQEGTFASRRRNIRCLVKRWDMDYNKFLQKRLASC